VDRQPDRPDLVGRHDGAASRLSEAAEAIERAIAASLVEGGPDTRTFGGNGDTKTVGAAIAELVKTV
jgi:isocitrate/isopropylmalate dehydrogenase